MHCVCKGIFTRWNQCINFRRIVSRTTLGFFSEGPMPALEGVWSCRASASNSLCVLQRSPSSSPRQPCQQPHITHYDNSGYADHDTTAFFSTMSVSKSWRGDKRRGSRGIYPADGQSPIRRTKPQPVRLRDRLLHYIVRCCTYLSCHNDD